MISTRGRYALRVMIDLAEHDTGGYVPMKEVARRQEISLKYIERIMPLLTQARLVQGVAGKGGGYRLCRPPESYRLGEILRVTEGDLAPVSCLEQGVSPCPRAASCRTLPVWENLYRMTNDYFDSITLAELLERPDGGDYVI